MAIKFFHGRRLQCHVAMKAPLRKANGDRQLVILFRLVLDGNNIRSAPAEVKAAYDAIKQSGQSESKPKREVENINGDFFNGPDTKSKAIRLKSLYLESLDVKESKNAQGDTAVVLTFQSKYEYDDKVWDWLGGNYKTDCFVEFDAAQASLLDIVEAGAEDPAGDEEQEDLPGTGEEEEQEEPATTEG
jgi:hypothetical protein